MTEFQHQATDKPPAMVGYKNADQSSDNIFSDIFRMARPVPGKEEISTGQIHSMVMPAGWEKRSDVRLPAGAGLVEFHPHGQDDVRLNAFYRGRRVGIEAANAFKECLAKPPHQLQDQELKVLAVVLRDKGSDFDIFSARTIDLNGKRVLSVEGCFKDQEKTGEKTLYVDSDGTGSAIQEISYCAHGKDYQRYLGEAEKAFRSIIWN